MSRLLLDALTPRRYPLCAVGYKRTREHLLSWEAVLPPKVRETKLSVSTEEQDAAFSPHSGSWLFLYENIPQLKYHNPRVKFSFEAHHGADSTLLFKLDGDETRSLVTTGLRQREIKERLQNFMDETTAS